MADYFTHLIRALFEEGRQSPASPAINASGWFPVYKGFDTGILVALLAFILIYLLWNRSKTGYEWTIMGQNSIFSRIGGCPNEENFTKAMLVSGALAALAGALVIMGGIQHRFMPGIKANYADDGIMIAIVANNKVVATAIYAIMFAIMRTGAMGMELETGVPLEFVHVLTAITVLFVVASREYSQYLIDRFSAFLRARRISSRIEDYAGGTAVGLWIEILRSSILAAIPIALASLGGAFTYYTDVFNVALEGMMLVGAFLAVIGTISRVWAMGLLVGALGVGHRYYLRPLRGVHGCRSFVTGMALNMFAVGGTTFTLRRLFGIKGPWFPPGLWVFPAGTSLCFPRSPVLREVISGHPSRCTSPCF